MNKASSDQETHASTQKAPAQQPVTVNEPPFPEKTSEKAREPLPLSSPEKVADELGDVA